LNGETYVVRVNEFSAMCNWQVVGVQVEQNRIHWTDPTLSNQACSAIQSATTQLWRTSKEIRFKALITTPDRTQLNWQLSWVEFKEWSHRVRRAMWSLLSSVHTGNKVEFTNGFTCLPSYQRVALAPYVHYLLSRRGEIENWVATKRSLGSVELSWIGRCDHYYDSTQLNWTHSQMFRITKEKLVTTGSVVLSRVAGFDHSAWSDSTQPVELSSVGAVTRD